MSEIFVAQPKVKELEVDCDERAEIVKEVFAKLSKIDVGSFVEKKQGLAYLPWSDCHSILMEEYPSAVVHTYWFQSSDGWTKVCKEVAGYSVQTGITIRGVHLMESLPIWDGRPPKAIIDPDAMDINTAVKRCFVKNAALWGLGLYLYRGEDLPIDTPITTPKPTKKTVVDEPISDKQKSEIEFLLAEKGISVIECEQKLTEKFQGKLKEGPVKIELSDMTAKKAAWLIKEIQAL